MKDQGAQLDLLGPPSLAQQLADESNPPARALLQVRALLAESKIHDFAWAEGLEGIERLAAYKRIRDTAAAAMEDAAETKLRTERRLGRLLAALGDGGRPQAASGRKEARGGRRR